MPDGFGFGDAVAISMASMKRRFQRFVALSQLGYAVDYAVRAALLFPEGTVLRDFSDEGCINRGRHQICVEGQILRSVMKHWVALEFGLFCGKAVLGLFIVGHLCLMSKAGGLNGVFRNVWRAMVIQQVLTFISVFLFVFYLAGVHRYIDHQTMHVYSASVGVSVMPFLLSELLRRHVEGMHETNRQLMVRESAQARADDFPRMKFKEIEKDQNSYVEPNCAICLADFSAQDSVSRLPCKHVFHTDCIRGWLSGGFHCGCPMRCNEPAVAPTVVGRARALAASRRRQRSSRSPSRGIPAAPPRSPSRGTPAPRP